MGDKGKNEGEGRRSWKGEGMRTGKEEGKEL